MKLRAQFAFTELVLFGVFFLIFLSFPILLSLYVSSEDLTISKKILLRGADAISQSSAALLTTIDSHEELSTNWRRTLKEHNDYWETIPDKQYWFVDDDIYTLWDSTKQSWNTFYDEEEVNQFLNELTLLTYNMPKDRQFSLDYWRSYLLESGQSGTETYTKLLKLREEIEQDVSFLRNYRADLRSVTYDMEESINSFQIKVLIILGSLFFIALIISVIKLFVFIRQISTKVITVESSMELVASGDFKSKMIIEGFDEFGSLAEDFNTFLGAFWSRLDSMFDVIRKMGEGFTNELGLEAVRVTLCQLALRNSESYCAAFWELQGDIIKLVAKAGEGSYVNPEQDNRLLPFINPDGIPNTFTASTIPAEARDLFPDKIGFSHLMILALSSESDSVPSYLTLVREAPFTDLELINMQSFGELCAMMLDNLRSYFKLLKVQRVASDLSSAEDLFKDILPPLQNSSANMAVTIHAERAEAVRGVYYDLIPVDSDSFLVLYGQFAEKTITNSLHTIVMRTLIRLIVRSNFNLANFIPILKKQYNRILSDSPFPKLGFLYVNNKKKEIEFSLLKGFTIFALSKGGNISQFDGEASENSESHVVKQKYDDNETICLAAGGWDDQNWNQFLTKLNQFTGQGHDHINKWLIENQPRTAFSTVIEQASAIKG